MEHRDERKEGYPLTREADEQIHQPIRVMFVDDEKKIRKLLRICIDWASIGFQVVADAASANQALELIPSENPDVVITDIAMPFINGLDFAQMVMEEHPHIRVVVLTAHDVFDYAKKGVDIGISRFLLKPIKRDELIEEMKNIRRPLLEERRKLYEQESLKKRLQDNWEFLVKKFLNDLIVNRFSPENLQDNLDYFQIPLHPQEGWFNILVLISVTSGDAEDSVMQMIQCEELVRSLIKRIPGLLLFPDMHQNLVLISENRKINLYSYASHFSTQIQETLGLVVYSGVGTPVTGLESLSKAYKQASAAAQVSKISQDRAFIPEESPDARYIHLRDVSRDILEELSLCLRVPLESKVLEQINAVYAFIEADPTIAFAHVTVISLTIVNTILTTVSDIGIPYDEIYQTAHLPYAHILKLEDVTSVKNYIINLIRYTIKQIDRYHKSARDKLVHTVLQYIGENLSNCSLSLKKLSELNYVNPSYLSRIFKEVTGTTFIDYLIDRRIEKSKKLLENTGLRIYEIAEAVGINDPNYFSKYFKKHTNLTPAQYKERFQAQGDAGID